MNTKKLTKAGLFMAIITITTLLVNIPIPGTKGYVNASEVAIFLTVLLLKDKTAVFAGALGPALADLILGYSFYAPITLVVKGIEALLALSLLKSKRFPLAISLSLGSLINPLGYFLAESVLYGLEVSLLGIPANIFQGLFGALVASLIYPLLSKNINKIK